MSKIFKLLLFVIFIILGIILPTPEFIGHAHAVWFCYFRRAFGILCWIFAMIMILISVVRKWKNET